MLSSGIAYLLWLPCICGLCGLHRIYAGRILSGVLWLLTLGLFGIGQFIDLFLIPSMIASANWSGGGSRNTNTNTNIVNVRVERERQRYEEDDYDDRPRRRR